MCAAVMNQQYVTQPGIWKLTFDAELVVVLSKRTDDIDRDCHCTAFGQT